MSKLEQISEYINQLSFDVKAELLVAVLVEHGIDLNSTITAFEGQFKRVWSKDIEWTSVERLETGDQKLSFHLNRDGIYDVLPEAVFHGNYEKENHSGKEMAKNSMKSRAEEKEARSFFQPFENEIFLQRVQLAKMENQLFRKIYSELLMGIIPYFWKVDPDLPQDYITRLKKLIPLVCRITGDFNLTAQCLEYILKEKVIITSSDDENPDAVNPKLFHHSGVIGESRLGIDTISGETASGFINHLIFSIGPIQNSITDELLKNGSLNRFLKCFYSYFIPYELDIETKYIFETEQSQLILDDGSNTEISYLSYNSVIN